MGLPLASCQGWHHHHRTSAWQSCSSSHGGTLQSRRNKRRCKHIIPVGTFLHPDCTSNAEWTAGCDISLSQSFSLMKDLKVKPLHQCQMEKRTPNFPFLKGSESWRTEERLTFLFQRGQRAAGQTNAWLSYSKGVRELQDRRTPDFPFPKGSESCRTDERLTFLFQRGQRAEGQTNAWLSFFKGVRELKDRRTPNFPFSKGSEGWSLHFKAKVISPSLSAKSKRTARPHFHQEFNTTKTVQNYSSNNAHTHTHTTVNALQMTNQGHKHTNVILPYAAWSSFFPLLPPTPFLFFIHPPSANGCRKCLLKSTRQLWPAYKWSARCESTKHKKAAANEQNCQTQVQVPWKHFPVQNQLTVRSVQLVPHSLWPPHVVNEGGLHMAPKLISLILQVITSHHTISILIHILTPITHAHQSSLNTCWWGVKWKEAQEITHNIKTLLSQKVI